MNSHIHKSASNPRFETESDSRKAFNKPSHTSISKTEGSEDLMMIEKYIQHLKSQKSNPNLRDSITSQNKTPSAQGQQQQRGQSLTSSSLNMMATFSCTSPQSYEQKPALITSTINHPFRNQSSSKEIPLPRIPKQVDLPQTKLTIKRRAKPALQGKRQDTNKNNSDSETSSNSCSRSRSSSQNCSSNSSRESSSSCKSQEVRREKDQKKKKVKGNKPRVSELQELMNKYMSKIEEDRLQMNLFRDAFVSKKSFFKQKESKQYRQLFKATLSILIANINKQIQQVIHSNWNCQVQTTDDDSSQNIPFSTPSYMYQHLKQIPSMQLPTSHVDQQIQQQNSILSKMVTLPSNNQNEHVLNSSNQNYRNNSSSSISKSMYQINLNQPYKQSQFLNNCSFNSIVNQKILDHQGIQKMKGQQYSQFNNSGSNLMKEGINNQNKNQFYYQNATQQSSRSDIAHRPQHSYSHNFQGISQNNQQQFNNQFGQDECSNLLNPEYFYENKQAIDAEFHERQGSSSSFQVQAGWNNQLYAQQEDFVNSQELNQNSIPSNQFQNNTKNQLSSQGSTTTPFEMKEKDRTYFNHQQKSIFFDQPKGVQNEKQRMHQSSRSSEGFDPSQQLKEQYHAPIGKSSIGNANNNNQSWSQGKHHSEIQSGFNQGIQIGNSKKNQNDFSDYGEENEVNNTKERKEILTFSDFDTNSMSSMSKYLSTNKDDVPTQSQTRIIPKQEMSNLLEDDEEENKTQSRKSSFNRVSMNALSKDQIKKAEHFEVCSHIVCSKDQSCQLLSQKCKTSHFFKTKQRDDRIIPDISQTQKRAKPVISSVKTNFDIITNSVVD